MPLVQPSTDRRRWYVPVQSEGAGEHLWFVDTGYDVTNCDDDLIERLGLQTRGGARIRGELGTVKARKATLPPLNLGGHRVEGIKCQVRDLNSTSSVRDPPEIPIGGVLGMDVLRHFRVVFDPATATLELDASSNHAALALTEPGVSKLKRPWFAQRVRLALDVEGHRLWPVVDTGAARTYIDGRLARLEPSYDGEVTVRGTGRTGSTVRSVDYYKVQQLSVGGLPAAPTTLMDRQRGWPVRHPGLLGLDVLRRYRQVYDFPRRRTRLEPIQPRRIPQWRVWRDQRLQGSAGRLEAADQES